MGDDISKYKYEEMANKVLRQDKRLVSSRSDPLKDAALSAPTSLAGKITMKDLGDRATATYTENDPNSDAAKQLAKKMAETYKEKEKEKSKKQALQSNRSKNSTLLGSSSKLLSLNYQPKSQETKDLYEKIVSWVSDQFDNDIQHDNVLSATDLILEILKDENTSDLEKQKQVEDIVSRKLKIQSFSMVLNWSSGITDYDQESAQKTSNNDDGFALIFDDTDDGEEGQGINQSSEDEGSSDDDFAGPNFADFIQDKNEETTQTTAEDVIKVASDEKSTVSKKSLKIENIDRFFLRRTVKSYLKADLNEVDLQETIDAISTLLHSKSPIMVFEQNLIELLEIENYSLIQLLIDNRDVIIWGLKVANVNDDAEKAVILQEFQSTVSKRPKDDDDDGNDELFRSETGENKRRRTAGSEPIRKPKIVNLDDLTFDQGSHLMTNTKVSLPKDSFKRIKKQYEEIHIPPPAKPTEAASLVSITTLPEWARAAFPSGETSTLNRIQSKVYPTAFEDDTNILLCAPTGAGKTNVAMLTILKTLSQYRNDDGSFDLKSFKIVYIAPLKALVQEQAREFSRRLEQYGIQVEELTGDSNLTKQQISETQILVTTPEKWDVITRKNSDTSYTNLVSLLIIDEIHLLHDERGPVLESIVARTLRNVEYTNRDVRLVGLSATLPNFIDVAKFLRVDESKGLFYFDSSYRPCPLAQQFIGITEKNSFKKTQAMNEACYDKILEAAGKHQVIIFVHSRKDTQRTAKWLRDKLLEEEKLGLFLKKDPASSEILRSESEKTKDAGLQDLLTSGFAIHHAGLSRDDRSRSEDLFAEGLCQILVSTATLAWGVNLPAHTVIIKGTEVYSPAKGDWTQLSPQDILQMLGRAGRPRYDESGEGIIITSQSDIQYYLAVLNQQLPIESQLMGKLADNLNAEIVLGTVNSLKDGVDWLGYSYLYVRMLKSPAVYRVGADYADDTTLEWKRTDLIHSALVVLHQNNLIIYDQDSGIIQSTDLGRISSHYYINYESMSFYNNNLKSHSSLIDLFRIFSSSAEFKLIPIRQEEKNEMTKLMERAPIAIKEDLQDPRAKANILLQSYISRLTLDGFALNADMVYITQSAGRLLRAIYEIVLKKQWARLTKVTLDLCKMVERRLWLSNTPLRQFPNCPLKAIKNAESSNLPWSTYFSLSDPSEMAQAIRDDHSAKKVFEMVKMFPTLNIECNVQTITPSLLRFELDITPEWNWDHKLHGNAEQFLLMVEDTNGEKILYTDTFVVRRNYANQVHLLDFTVPISNPTPPNYFISLVSEKWLHCGARVPVVLSKLKIPKKFPAPTQLLDLHPIPVADLKVDDFDNLFEFTHFNKFQTQVFHSVYNSNENIFFGAVKSSGKTTLAELALLNHWRQNKGRAVYLCPSQENIDRLTKLWNSKFGALAGNKSISKLTNELAVNLKLLSSNHLILATPTQYDKISRRWQQRRNIQSIELLIIDDVQTLGNGSEGFVYENVISRMKFMDSQLGKDLRIVALGTSLANGRDFGEWIGADKNNIFNFASTDRVRPLEIHLQSYSINHNPSMIIAMTKIAYQTCKASVGSSNLVFVPTRPQAMEIGFEFSMLAAKDGITFLNAELEVIQPLLKKLTNKGLIQLLSNGIGIYFKDMDPNDKKVVDKLYNAGALSVLFATKDTSAFAPVSDFVIVLSTQSYEGKEHRYVDYTINELLEMVGCSQNGEHGSTDKALVLTNTTNREYFKKFLNESLPMESFLNVFLQDAFVNEISTGLIKSRQDCIDWLTYSYFYRRVQANPSFYGVKDVSHVGLSTYLTELVEETLNELVEANMIELEEEQDQEEEEEEEDQMEIAPLNGALLASYHNVSFTTMKTFALSLTKRSKLKSILEIITSAAEFDGLPIRQHESTVLKKLYSRVPVKSSQDLTFDSPYLKAFILLQAHFSRIPLPNPDLVSDQKFILGKIITLLHTVVDLLSSEGHLNAMYAMDLTQMVVQAVWDTDSSLKQIPFITDDIVERAQKYNVETVLDFMGIEEDEERNDILRLNGGPLNKVAEFVNKYPNIEVAHQSDSSVVSDQSSEVIVTVTRDEEPEDLYVVAPVYPFEKSENWWLVLGDSKAKELYAIRKITVSKEEQDFSLEFTIPTAGKRQLSIWCICDSYVDADKEVTFDVDVKQSVRLDEEVE